MESLSIKLVIKICIYYGSWLMFPLLVWFGIKRRWIRFVLSLIIIYARFIEPNIVHVDNHKINTGFKAKYALISDIHLGIYNDSSILRRTVRKINQLNVDAVLIAGDFTYEPHFADMKELFAPLADLKKPIIAVLGNHDCERPGPRIRDELEDVLFGIGVSLITNKALRHNDVTIVGLGSRWAGEDKVELLQDYSKEDKVIVLTHNPDTALDYPSSHYPDLTLAGHTHGGQIRIPFIYKFFLPVRGGFLWDRGLYNYRDNQVFVSSGLGQIGLPFRFLIPPVIDVLELY